ncbi:hypothetical protein LJC23_07375, partial [Desulfovibrio sp. OttesenSCG-928-I05]|nr:hypothetical protein [Desulfovibrio sp. OttesenSCG-928-I05]
ELENKDCIYEVMKYACVPYVGGKTLTSDEMFPFLFSDFEREILVYAIKIGKRLPASGEAFTLYEEKIKSMLFKRVDIENWIDHASPQGQLQDGSIPATDYMKSFAWLQERWGNIQLEDVAVILWKHEIRPSRISASPGSITGFPPESFYTMGSLTGEDSEEKKRLFHIDQRQVEKLEREHPNFTQITDEDRQKYRAEITPRPAFINLKKGAVPTNSEPANQGEMEQHIKAWADVLPNLRGAEATAAKLAIEKWRSKSHSDAYKAALPDGCASNPKSFVSNKRVTAQGIANSHGLTMPDWKSDTE